MTDAIKGIDVEEVIEEINVEKIMEEIRREIREKGYTNDMLNFNDISIEAQVSPSTPPPSFDREALASFLNQLRQNVAIETYRPIVSYTRFAKRFVVFFKKAIRKCIRFYIDPLIAEQNHKNFLTLQCLDTLFNYTVYADSKFVSDISTIPATSVAQNDKKLLQLQLEILRLEHERVLLLLESCEKTGK